MSYAFEDAEEPQPVMTGDNAVDTFGMGQLIYASQEDESANSYLTYSPSTTTSSPLSSAPISRRTAL